MKFLTSLTLAVGLTAQLWAAEVEPGFISLFNGKDLSGWDGNPKIWSVQDGAITGKNTAENPIPKNTFLIWRDGEVSNFELRFSYKIVGGNSGLQYRSIDKGNWVVNGYQADFEAGKSYSGILYEEGEGRRGILAQRGQWVWIQPDGEKRVVGSLGKTEEIQSVIKNEDWNDYTIIARGNHLTHIINGRVTAEVIDDQADKAAKKGILAFQVHAGPPMTVQIKNVRIKGLPPQ